MAKKARKLRPWTKEDISVLKALAREKPKTPVIARQLTRTVRGVQQKAITLGVKLGASQRKKKA